MDALMYVLAIFAYILLWRIESHLRDCKQHLRKSRDLLSTIRDGVEYQVVPWVQNNRIERKR